MFIVGEERAAVDKIGLAERIKLIRKEKGLKQQQFADKIGFSKNYIHYVEVRRYNPSENFIKRIAATFNISYDWLMTGIGDMKAEKKAVSDQLIAWLSENPDVITELEKRAGLL